MYYEVEQTLSCSRTNNSVHTHTQAQQPKWVVNNSIVTPTTGQEISNSLGNTAKHTQNAIWDKDGNLKIYAEDGFVYDASGQQLVPDPTNAQNPNTTGHSEFIFVPVPGECDKYYSFSVDLILDQSVAGYQDGFGLVLVYSIIDLNLNDGHGGVQPLYNDAMEAYFSSNWIMIDQSETQDGVIIENYHIGATKTQEDGSRYLFLSGGNTLKIFEISQNGINLLALSPPMPASAGLKWNGYIRSELEIFEGDNGLTVAFGCVGIDKPCGQCADQYNGWIEIMYFTKPTLTSGLTYNSDAQRIISNYGTNLSSIKGIEFSPDGKYLYVSRVESAIGGDLLLTQGVMATNDIIYFARNSAGYFLNYYNFIYLGSNTSDFAYGMMEVDENGALWIAGNGRLGKLVDANDPSSAFIANAILFPNIIPSTITNHDIGLDWIWKYSYLLPDQIDGEDYSDYFYQDQFPETLYVCNFPYQVVSNYQSDWSFSYLADSEPPAYEIVELGTGLAMEVPYEGFVTINYQNNNGCSMSESFYIMLEPVAQYGADFTYSTNVSGSSLTITTTPLAPFATHLWTVSHYYGGNWVVVNSSTASTPVFTNLNSSTQYKVDHQITPVLPFSCQYNSSSFQIIN